MKLDRGNVIAVARREYLARGRTRTFKWSTILLMVVGVAAALSPLIFRYIDQGAGQTTIEVSVGQSKPGVDAVASLSAVLNAGPSGAAGGTGGAGTGAGAGTPSTPKFRVVGTEDVAAARARVVAGESDGLFVLARATPDADLTFDFISKHVTRDRIVQTVYQAASTIATQDRLATRGIPPAEQPALFAPPAYSVTPADPNAAPNLGDQVDANSAIGFVLAILLFLAIVLYGQWIAYSVAEEKSSRVMELILGAATPFELLAGKVVGVGALAMTQYLLVAAGAVVAMVFQDQIAAAIFGGAAAGVALPSGLSIPLLLAFGGFFILGFALFASLYAGAAALVSRTEDINQIVAPMTLIASAGYLVAVYTTTGLLDANSLPVQILSYVPFFSPYLMVSRVGAGLATPLEALVALAILAITVPFALWLAARFYAAGVLMYGQRPSLRLMLRVLRGAR